jgi:uncharacterized protein
MVTARQITKLADEIAAKFSPQTIILFGSYAYGTPTEDSDVDLLVVKDYPGPSYRAASRIAVCPGFPTEIIVRSQREIQRRIDIEDWFIVEIMEQGIVLYEANDPRVRERGRRRFRERLHPLQVADAQTALSC